MVVAMGMPVKKEGEKSWPDGAATRMHTNDYRKFSDAEKNKKAPPGVHIVSAVAERAYGSYIRKPLL